MKNKKALVLLSGGQDSATCLYWAKQTFKEVVAVGFNYGQKHVAELEQAKKIASDANIQYIIFDIKGMLNGSSLTDHSKDHNDTQNSLPQSFTAGRNLLFIASVLNYCYLNNIEDIITGTCQTDFSGYPDCRRNFINSMELALSLATDNDYRIHTPLMYLTKAETWKLAKELGCIDVVINDSMTDYNGSKVRNDWGFGELNNGASELRAKGFYEAKEKGWI